ncbi:calcium-transporting ATPase 2, endoplasmic reticulum-type isoform X2 [Selaginella moellendorffii]|uniref:calcium-transporting ATPase 2, endoplasmic reticulum-type isoform X2 n=1 Tax=Selaginella moellendorffii TaxID=88036 RepID=UPI000D1C4710|nr:calcium-transporting ATPase 2, endoplasmic reticulum-type isoform X2 [Selaginella moellendorffii]|eukprot:XP_024541081.1 calcium-transporting ATPase 2, endoplasmic reticulum-type isoform X2 [Selaginella moellendorffii]
MSLLHSGYSLLIRRREPCFATAERNAGLRCDAVTISRRGAWIESQEANDKWEGNAARRNSSWIGPRKSGLRGEGVLDDSKKNFSVVALEKHPRSVRCCNHPAKKGAVDVAEKISSPSILPGKHDSKPESVESSRPPYPAWARPVEVVADFFDVDISKGLNRDAVDKKRTTYGWNELQKPEGTSFWKLVLEQFDDTLVQILLAAAGVSFALAFSELEPGSKLGPGAFTEPLVILSIIILNAVIGVWQESKAESTLQALKEMQSEEARVLRDGREIVDLPARELVPGDIVELRAGDKASADMRVAFLKSGTIRLQQAALTGESQPVLKQPDSESDEEVEIQGKDNMVFAGTTVTNGSCICIVTDTGMATEIGKIQTQIQDASLSDYDSPLTRKLDEFADVLTKVVAAICGIVWVVNYKYFLTWDVSNGLPSNVQFDVGQATYYFKVAVALAVAAIPEGLPAVITTCLALGTRRMAEENAIVRKLPSVETLGCTTVICSDKTGTLTTNQMSVVQLLAVEGPDELRTFRVTGTSYDPDDGHVIGLPSELDHNLRTLARICALCNDAGIQFKNGSYSATGMPTEAAMLVLVEKLGVQDKQSLQKFKAKRMADPVGAGLSKELCLFLIFILMFSFLCSAACAHFSKTNQRLFTLEFDRVRKSMSVIVKEDEGNSLLVKGAAEFVLERCTSVQLKDGSVVPLTPSFRENIISCINAMTSKGLRVLALASKSDLGPLSDYTGPDHPAQNILVKPESYVLVESQLTFVGLAGLQDPPRPEVKEAIDDCKRAGIRVIVITGDNKNTAEAICCEIGLFSSQNDLSEHSLTGKDFMKLSVSDRRALLLGNKSDSKGFVFSRSEPIHKQEIVRVLKDGGEIVAMTGDGVNDAPALKLADIGIAMGLSGTEVAKEASDMVLADDDFATIVVAVREGRSIYDNMRAFIRYLISSNIGEVVAIFLTAILGMPQGLIPVQLLWVNLVTDGAPATALGFNPPDTDIMDRPPRLPTEGFISGWTLFRFLTIGLYVGLATIGIFGLWYLNDDSFLGIDLSRDGHTAVSFQQLSHWGECPLWPEFHANPVTIAGNEVMSFASSCDYFTVGKLKPSTLAMSTLVMIEMFNALNALSETNSLLKVRPWANKWLLVAIAVSLGLHGTILYTPWLAEVFGVVPLDWNDWLLVIAFSFPVIPLDEALKLAGRVFFLKNEHKKVEE